VAALREPEPGTDGEEETKDETTSVDDTGNSQQTTPTPSLDGLQLNPVELGRKSRQFVDTVWQRVLSLGSRSGTADLADELLGERRALYVDEGDERSALAALTTILVVGATGRVGTILVRKLALRGYTVRALVRNIAAADGLPTGVQLIEGDVGDAAAVARAMAGGVSKVIMCARARTDISSDVTNVERTGVQNLIKALLDAQNAAAMVAKGRRRGERNKITLFKFRGLDSLAGWDQDATTTAATEQRAGAAGAQGFRRVGLVKEASCSVAPAGGDDQEGELDWSGYVFGRGDAQISGPMPKSIPAHELATCDGLVLRCQGDGKRYSCVLHTSSGHWYAASFPTRNGSWQPVRLPFADFRAVAESNAESGPVPPLDPGTITRLGFRFETRAQPKKAGAPAPAATPAAAKRGGGRGAGLYDPDEEFRALLAAQQSGPGPDSDNSNAFRLCISMVKALPGGAEPDFVLVSCAGAGLDQEEAEKVVTAKRQGEALLRNSGLGYTILRPGPLLEAPGGYKALVFDQGGRISEGITCADVADVCVQALHDSEARNKSFDVCHEYTPAAGESRFELVAHLPGKSGSYLTTGLQGLAKNT